MYDEGTKIHEQVKSLHPVLEGGFSFYDRNSNKKKKQQIAQPQAALRHC